MFRSRIFSSLLSIATIYTCVYLARTCVLDNPDVAPELRGLVNQLLKGRRHSWQNTDSADGSHFSSSNSSDTLLPDLTIDGSDIGSSLTKGLKKSAPARAPSPGPVTIHNNTIKDDAPHTPAAELPKVINPRGSSN